jgi:excisionase family DNA binding protein
VRGFYTTHEAARLLGVTLPTVVNWIKARRLKAHRTPGGHRRIAREELAAFMLRIGVPLPEELAGAAAARRKALVIGAAGPLREGVARQLARAGLAVEQASPGFAAGAAVARYAPDAVVLCAPGADGGETLRALRADREAGEVPVVWLGPGPAGEGRAGGGHLEALGLPLAEEALAAAVGRALAAARPPGTAR